MIRNRDIVLAVIFSILSCGIYQIYWWVVLTDEIGDASGDRSISGGLSVLFTIITCGLYGLYWAYKMGENLEIAKRKRGIMNGSDMAVVYLLFQLFNLNIVNLCIMQSEMNKMS